MVYDLYLLLIGSIIFYPKMLTVLTIVNILLLLTAFLMFIGSLRLNLITSDGLKQLKSLKSAFMYTKLDILYFVVSIVILAYLGAYINLVLCYMLNTLVYLINTNILNFLKTLETNND